MSYLQIPTRTDRDNYSLQLTLDGTQYEFAFVWNFRTLTWEMTIAGVVDSLAIRVLTDLLAAVPLATKPPGRLFAFDTSGAGADPGMTDLGARVLLIYEESA